MKWLTFKGAWYEKSFKYDWLSLSSAVGLIEMYANTKKDFSECTFITDKNP